MPLDWLNTPLDADISVLIARKRRSKAIDELKSQLQGRLAPSIQIRLQLADLLVQAGRAVEAIPILIGLADEFSADGFVAKGFAILKRVERIEPGRADVESRLALLVQQQQRIAATEVKRPARAPVFGMEEIGEAPPATAEIMVEPMVEEDPGAAGPTPELPFAEPQPPVAEAVAEPAVTLAPPVEVSTPIVEPPAPAAPRVSAQPVAPPVSTQPEPSPVSTQPVAVEGPPAAPAPGVAQRIRSVFRKFLSSLPGGSAAPGVTETPLARPEEVSSPVAEPPAAGEPVLPATSPEPQPAHGLRAEEGLDPMPETVFEEQLLDIIQDILDQPALPPVPVTAGGQAVDRSRVVGYAQQLLAMPLFGDLSEEELLAVVQGLRLHVVEAGDVVVTEGEPGHSLFVLTTGTVKVFVRNPAGRNFEVAELREGDFFGEISSLSGRPRTATVTAAAPCELLELDKGALDDVARRHPRVCQVLESFYIQRASSPEAAAVRSVPLSDAETHRKAIEVLESHFGVSRWDPRMRLRLADVLLKAGKQLDALPILIGLADELAREGYPEKAVAILKKIEKVRRRDVEEVNLAPLTRTIASAEAAPPPTESSRPRTREQTDDRFHGWLVDVVRDAVTRRRASGTRAETLGQVHGYGPGLMASPLFQDFGEEELLAFIEGLRLLVFAPGDIIVTEGEPGQSLFILTTGAVKVFVRDPAGRSVPLSTLGEGSFFGEISTLSGRPRSATVTAAAHCELLEMDRPTLDDIARRHPRVREVLEEFSVARATDPQAAAIRIRGET